MTNKRLAPSLLFPVTLLLLTLMGFSLIRPALMASKESNLPECCRRDGKHQCAMSGAKAPQSHSSGGPEISASKRCAFFPTGAQAAIQSSYADVSPARKRFCAHFLKAPVFRGVVIRSRERLALGWLKGGPPAFLLT